MDIRYVLIAQAGVRGFDVDKRTAAQTLLSQNHPILQAHGIVYSQENLGYWNSPENSDKLEYFQKVLAETGRRMAYSSDSRLSTIQTRKLARDGFDRLIAQMATDDMFVTFGYRTFLPGYSERVQIKNFEDGYLTGELPQAGFKPTQKTIEYYTELFKNRKIKIDLKKDQEKKDKESSDNTEQQD